MARSPITDGRRRALAARYGLTGSGDHAVPCHWCGDVVTFYMGPAPLWPGARQVVMDTAVIDHLEAVVNGGTNALDNLVFACWPCNASRGHKHWIPPRLARIATDGPRS